MSKSYKVVKKTMNMGEKKGTNRLFCTSCKLRYIDYRRGG